MRRVKLPRRAADADLADTVGFIDRLPHQLVAAFHATLEEVTAADLLVHVIDASVAGPRAAHRRGPQRCCRSRRRRRCRRSRSSTRSTCSTVDELAGLQAAHPDALFISATTATGRATLIDGDRRRVCRWMPSACSFELDERAKSDRRLVADLYRHARSSATSTDGERVSIEADVPRRLMGRFRRAKVPA